MTFHTSGHFWPDSTRLLAFGPDGTRLLAFGPDGTRLSAFRPDGTRLSASGCGTSVLRPDSIIPCTTSLYKYNVCWPPSFVNYLVFFYMLLFFILLLVFIFVFVCFMLCVMWFDFVCSGEG